ncbi:MAG: phenylalanine--tRNA ligase subunit beta [Candidatus Hydrothermota bacterium]|nr:MAG: phenylalanine--tRNA ligase subunit beta [Candidatus Hydrothermae bacterium]
MKVLYNWLKELVDFDYLPHELVDVFESLGIEVEDFEYLGEGLERKLVVAEIVDVQDHPHSQKLKVLKLWCGGEKTAQVVVGAPGIRPKRKVAYLLPGAKLPNGMVVEKRMIRGVLSEGMLASEEDLGLDEKSETVIFLDDVQGAKTGKSALPFLGLDDYRYDLKVTPNRSDLLGLVGLAYDLRAKSGGKLHIPNYYVVEHGNVGIFPVRIEDFSACPRYTARIIRDVKVNPSPTWLKRRLMLIGQRPINNVVDITNYVLYFWGHPIHAFDLDKLVGEEIVVRFAKDGERILTLDGVERELHSEILIIADAERPVAIAGVIGGEETGVTESTRNVLIESAFFDPAVVRKAVTSLKVSTESSYRFERTADISMPPIASSYAAKLIAEIAEGRVGPLNDVYRELPSPKQLELRMSYLKRLLGVELSQDYVVKIFERLGFDVRPMEGKVRVLVPMRRRDISLEADLVEEVARLYGYDRIEGEIPSGGSFVGRKEPSKVDFAREVMLKIGFDEVKGVEFVSKQEAEAFTERLEDAVKILNPLSENYAYVRPSVIPSLLSIASLNLRRGNREIKIFEVGRKFKWRGPDVLPLETDVVAALVTGMSERSWIEPERQLDYFELKGALEALAGAFGVKLTVEPTDGVKFLDPSGIVKLGPTTIGVIGEVPKNILKIYDIKVPVFVFEVELTELSIPVRRYKPLPKFPPVKRDISVVMDEDVPFKVLEDAIYSVKPALLVNFRVIDVYHGEPLPKGKKSITLTLLFQHPERTLTDQEVDEMFNNLVNALISKGFGIRGITDEGTG